MAYTVGYSDSTKTAININDGELDNTTDITLLGKNYARYGQIVAEDLLHMLENFASGTAPTSPCLLYTSPSPRDAHESRMPSSA